MHQKIIFLFLVILLISAFFPSTVSALVGTYTACEGDINPDGTACLGPMTEVCYEGLVPCGQGKIYWTNGSVVNGQCNGDEGPRISGDPRNRPVGIPCQLCHFFIMLQRILDYTIEVVIIIAVLMVVVAGGYILLSRGNPGLLQTGIKIGESIAWGLVFIFAAWLVVNTILMALGIAQWTGLANWFQIKCLISLPSGAAFNSNSCLSRLQFPF